jgi:signal transduction histidine kinase
MMTLDSLTHDNRGARILIVDDEQTNVTTLERILNRAGYPLCFGLSNPHIAIPTFFETKPDLLLLDWHMGSLCGKDILTALKERLSPAEMPPVLVLTADQAPETRREALLVGATDFLSKPLDYMEVLLRIRNLLQVRTLQQQHIQVNHTLESLVSERTARLEQTIAELKELQQHVVRHERLRALGAMAGGIAHDFNNALMVMRGYSEMFIQEPELCRNPEKVLESFQTIGMASRDAAEIVRRLREFYRPYSSGEEDRRPVDLNQLVREAVNLAQPIWQTQAQAAGLQIEMKLDLGEPPLVPASEVELREVLINLIFNSVDALPKGGAITLRTGVEEKFAFFEVEDSGVGMTEEIRRHCLEPFYTTKGDRGTGLGLAITYGIVRRHRGIIRVNSEVDQGTQFSILLPLNETQEETVAEPEGEPFSYPLNVLVVDDQPSICQLLSSSLRHDSHTVELAADGREGLEKFRAGHFDVVITDRVMPRMNGEQLASKIKAISPHQPVILLTGCMEDIALPEHVDLLIRKPTSMHDIRQAIHKVVPLSSDRASSHSRHLAQSPHARTS